MTYKISTQQVVQGKRDMPRFARRAFLPCLLQAKSKGPPLAALRSLMNPAMLSPDRDFNGIRRDVESQRQALLCLRHSQRPDSAFRGWSLKER